MAVSTVIIGVIVIFLINLAGWSLYMAIHDAAINFLGGFLGLSDQIILNLLIVAIALAIVIILTRMKLRKAIKDIVST
jgi:hypothetical protein